VEDLAKLLPKFLKLNTIPVICHQDGEVDVKRVQKKMNGSLPELWRVKVDTQIHKHFQLANWTFAKSMRHVPKMLKAVAVDKKSFIIPLNSIGYVNMRVEMALFVVDNGTVIKCSYYEKDFKRYLLQSLHVCLKLAVTN